MTQAHILSTFALINYKSSHKTAYIVHNSRNCSRMHALCTHVWRMYACYALLCSILPIVIN